MNKSRLKVADKIEDSVVLKNRKKKHKKKQVRLKVQNADIQTSSKAAPE
jgi:hypothetical protein